MGDEPQRVIGILGVFEGLPLVRQVRQLTQGIWLWAGFGLGVCFGIGLLLSMAVTSLVPDGYYGPAKPIVGILCVGVDFFAVYGLKRLADLAIQRRWYARGVPRELTVTYEVRRDGLYTASELGHGTTYWSSINEVALGAGYWLFLTAGTATHLPRRIFASAEAEHAFMAAAVEHLLPEAQERSRKAEDFLSKKA